MDENCDDDLNCTMQKHRIDAVVVNNEGVLLIPQKATKSEEKADGTGGFISPSRTLNTLNNVSTRTQALFISTRQSETTSESGG